MNCCKTTRRRGGPTSWCGDYGWLECGFWGSEVGQNLGRNEEFCGFLIFYFLGEIWCFDMIFGVVVEERRKRVEEGVIFRVRS